MNKQITLLLAFLAVAAGAVALWLLPMGEPTESGELTAQAPAEQRERSTAPAPAAPLSPEPELDASPVSERRIGRAERRARMRQPRPELASREPMTARERTQVRDAVHQDHIDEINDAVAVYAESAGWTVDQTDLVLAELELRMERWHELRPLRRQGRTGRREARVELEIVRTDSDARIAEIVGEDELAAMNEAVWGGEKRRGPPRGF